MTKENKFKIGLCLQGIALSMDEITLKANEDRIKLIEDIIIAEPTGDETSFDIETYCKEHFCVMVDKDVWEKAEKALKQENILDEMFENIKTEIDFIPTYGAKFADGSINVHVNKKDVLQIIDKYRGEQCPQ